MGGGTLKQAGGAAVAPAASDLRARIAGVEQWYHTIELAPGVRTPGFMDLEGLPARIGFPESMAGMRCLDVGTFDGFWAFEMERRGAAEVHAIDVLDPRGWDWPAASEEATLAAMAARKAGGQGFTVAHAALGSKVSRRELSVYDLDPESSGTFDFVFAGSILLHLRDPVRALERIRDVCRGELLVFDCIDLGLTLKCPRRPIAALDGMGRPWWWRPNLAGLQRMVESAGFEMVCLPRRANLRHGAGLPRIRPTLRGLAGPHRAQMAAFALRRDPHAAIRARPRYASAAL